MGMSPALLKKIAEARATAGGNNIKDGEYVLLVKKIIVDSKFKGTTFIAEFDVVDCEKTHATVEPNPKGTDCSIALNLDTNVLAPGNMKQFFLGLLGLDEATTPAAKLGEEMSKYTADDQPGRGMLIECSTYRKVTKTGPNAGKEGVYPRWYPASEGNSSAEVAARRKVLDAAGR
jgi:hypothetical protein